MKPFSALTLTIEAFLSPRVLFFPGTFFPAGKMSYFFPGYFFPRVLFPPGMAVNPRWPPIQDGHQSKIDVRSLLLKTLNVPHFWGTREAQAEIDRILYTWLRPNHTYMHATWTQAHVCIDKDRDGKRWI